MYDLEEQEKVDALRAWWKQNGRLLILGLAVFIAIIAGVQYWKTHQANELGEAAGLYNGLQAAVVAADAGKVRQVAGELIEKYPSTPYASRAALISARMNVQSGDGKSAQAQLRWAIDHADEPLLQDIARVTLAGILLDDKKYGEAGKVLEARHSKAFDHLFNDLKGDILVAQGKPKEARAAYEAALKQVEENSPFKQYIQLKLDAVGEPA